jgi:L-lactate dehydrogenase complex protein LldF
MANIFRARIRQSLSDGNLQAALDANASKRIMVRQEAFSSLQDPQALRQRAHAVRAEVIDHLDGYLQQFIAQAEANGMYIHRAEDAAQAIQIVLELASQHGARRVAKSKTMVSEELGLNRALEKHGLEVVETDLGEYIVQLRGEAPSHIITPAVHLRRQDVGRLFQEKLGMPYTDDISVMTNLARKTLRQVFLNADAGVSGVNFGVAETGTLCVVTNEGNGRMVTTLPPVHIALMGIERLVPSMDDLSLMLSLLPRSATGQKLSVYTSLLNGPRWPVEADGPMERHVILVDNGRRAVRDSGLQEILYCIRCGACLNACPVFREIGGHAYVSRDGKGSPYPGPMGSVVSPALFGQFEYGHLARASSLCGACREACPVDIDLPRLLLRVRNGVQTGPYQPKNTPNVPLALALGLKLYSLAASSHWRFSLAQRLAGLYGALTNRFSRSDAWIHLPAISGWGYSKDFPRPPAQSFQAKYKKQLHVWPALNQPRVQTANIPAPEQNELPPKQKQYGKETFATELLALGGHYDACTLQELPSKILELLSRQKIGQLLAWDEANLPPGLLEQLATAGISIIHPTSETTSAVSQVRAGLTGALAGIANTGSLVLTSGPGRPLSASLLPEVHIAILWEGNIVEDLGQVLSRQEVKEASAAVVITGPSRTADIEMTLTIGVHGPGDLHVFCLHDH